MLSLRHRSDVFCLSKRSLSKEALGPEVRCVAFDVGGAGAGRGDRNAPGSDKDGVGWTCMNLGE